MKTSTERDSLVSQVRMILARHRDQALSMADLLAELSPEDSRQRSHLYKILADAAFHELRGYATLGEARPGKGFSAGKMVRPIIWQAPSEDILTPAPVTLDTLAARVTELERVVALLTRKR